MPKNEKKNISLSAPAVVSPFHIEVDKTVGGFTLSCSGVKGISEFSDSEINLNFSSFSLVINGKKLSMTVFEGKCVEIIGKISEVRFVYAKT